MRRALLAAWLGIAAFALAAGCRRAAEVRLDPVSALKTKVRPAFAPPPDGLLKPAQLDLFLRVRGRGRGDTEGDALRALGADPIEFAWIRSRIQEALLALDADRVAAAASEGYARALAALRGARKAVRDPKTAARMEGEIATLERERATLRRSGAPATSLARNAALISPRRAAIETAGP